MTKLYLDDFYRLIPKIDLHYHLLGGVRLETMLHFAKKYKVDLPVPVAKSFYREYQLLGMPRKGGIEALTFLYSIMKDCSDYHKVITEVAEDAKAVGLRYIETFWNPSDCPIAYDQLHPELIKSVDLAEKIYGVTIRFIPSINRETSPEIALDMVKNLISNPHPYVLGIGIDYKEQLAPVENFWKAYKLAKQHGLRLTAHCSEFGLHWRNVETGIELIGCERIDHGYTITENPELTKKYAHEGVPFTVIPTNTYYLSQWTCKKEWQKKHPIRKMAEAGLNIIPCTDDWHIHNTNSAKCYLMMVEDFGFDLDGIRTMVENSILAAWISEEQKCIWKKEWLSEFDELRSRLMNEPKIDKEHHIHYKRP